MTQMGLDYQKYKESQRHNLVSEDVSKREVATKEFTSSFEPYRVGATVMQAEAAKQNAATNKYTASFEPYRVGATVAQAEAAKENAATNRFTASFEPRRVAATEKQAAASMKQANVQQSKFNLDASWREFEENLKAQEVAIKDAKNEIDLFIAQLNALPNATKASLAAAGLDLGTAGESMAAVEAGMDKGMSYFGTITNALKSLGKSKSTK